MAIIDKVSDLVNRVIPAKNQIPMPVSTSATGGIGGGHASFEDDMIVSKPHIIFATVQVFFNFLAMCCFASVASFQSKWHIGVSGLTGFALFTTIAGMSLSLFMLLVPVIYEKYDKFARLTRALREVRVGFILSGAGTVFSLLLAFIVTISAWTEAGCKNANNDPHAGLGDSFKSALPGWCNTKKAAAIFMWFAFVGWLGTLGLTFRDFRSGASTRPRDPPFQHPTMGDDHEDFDEDGASSYVHIPPARRPTADNSQSPSSPFNDRHQADAGGYSYSSSTPPVLPRPSMDAYGAFSDPAPTGYGSSPARQSSYGQSGGGGGGENMSRTMQYADPYAAVRASIAGGGGASTPPSYDGYQGYR